MNFREILTYIGRGRAIASSVIIAGAIVISARYYERDARVHPQQELTQVPRLPYRDVFYEIDNESGDIIGTATLQIDTTDAGLPHLLLQKRWNDSTGLHLMRTNWNLGKGIDLRSIEEIGRENRRFAFQTTVRIARNPTARGYSASAYIRDTLLDKSARTQSYRLSSQPDGLFTVLARRILFSSSPLRRDTARIYVGNLHQQRFIPVEISLVGRDTLTLPDSLTRDSVTKNYHIISTLRIPLTTYRIRGDHLDISQGIDKYGVVLRENDNITGHNMIASADELITIKYGHKYNTNTTH